MYDLPNGKTCLSLDGASAEFWAERRRFLNALLPVRRHTVSITFQKGANRHALTSKAAKLAV